MEINPVLKEAIKYEFTCYYHANLPDEWNRTDDEWADMATASARRLASRIKSKPLCYELADLFIEAAKNSQHPVVQFICDIPWIDWYEEEKDWQLLQQLLRVMAAGIRNLH